MFGIPFIGSYIQRVVKEQPVADSVDWLNYYCTSLMLAFFAFMISAKQYFGSPIQCWVPMEFKGGWEKYTENYCFIANSYHVPMDEEVPSDPLLRHDEISYYRWVPVVLAIQAFFFWLPNWLWNMLHKQTAVNPRATVNEARASRSLCGAEREKEVEKLAAYVTDTLEEFQPQGKHVAKRSGYNATFLYLVTKSLYVLNATAQLLMLNYFLGGNYFTWGYEVRRLANKHNYSVQCVIMMNMINEKLYFFLYFWLIFVAIVTLINFVYYLFMMLIPPLREKYVLHNINKREQKMRGLSAQDMKRFVQDHLRPDGVLLIHFMRRHIGGRVTYDLLNELMRLYWIRRCRPGAKSETPSSDRQPLLRGENYQRNIQQTPNTYKPTLYGPASLFPHPASAPPKSRFIDDELENIDDVDDGTLPIRHLHERTTPLRQRNDNLYSTPQASPQGHTSVSSV
ncbi:innexin family protein [Aphelenchoides avenae]|nr:innexin family protein [Aphelenchus avenae]